MPSKAPKKHKRALPLLTNSRRTTFQICPRRHHYQYELRKSLIREDRTFLKFGSLIHFGLENWLKAPEKDRLEAGIEGIRVYYREQNTEHERSPFELVTAEVVMTGYDARWGSIPFECVGAEIEFLLPLLNPENPKSSSRLFRIAGKMDGVVDIEWEGTFGRFVIEHKCQVGSTAIDLSSGRTTLRKWFSRGGVEKIVGIGPNGKLGLYEAGPPVPDTVRDVYSVRTKSGRHARVSDNHPFLTARGWVCAVELTRNDWVAIPRKTLAGGSFEIADDQVKFVGHMIGDGHFTENGIGYTKLDQDDRELFLALCDRLGYRYRVIESPDHAPCVRFSQAVESKPRQLLESLGLYGLRSTEKLIPCDLFDISDYQTQILLGGLWDTDGCVDVFEEHRNGKIQQKIRICYTSRSEQLCRDIQSLLLRLGINSSVTESSVEYAGSRRPYWQVKVIGRGSKRDFLVRVVEGGIPVPRAIGSAQDALGKLKPGDDRPVPSDRIRHLLKTGEHQSRYDRARSVQANTLEKSGINGIESVLNEEIFWDRVDSVIISGRERMYSLTVDEVHNYVSDDIITHNTTKPANLAPGSSYWRRLRMDGQVSMYWDAAERRGWELEGTIYDVIGRPGQIPYEATTEENKKWTQGKPCKLCRNFGLSPVVDMRGFPSGKILVKTTGAELRPDCPVCHGSCYEEPPHLYAKLREFSETPEQFRDRLTEIIAEEPWSYYQRGIVTRLDFEIAEARWDLWQTAKNIRAAERAGHYPRYTNSCDTYNRLCPFFDVCTNSADINDPHLYETRTLTHPELSEEIQLVHEELKEEAQGHGQSEEQTKNGGGEGRDDYPELGF